MTYNYSDTCNTARNTTFQTPSMCRLENPLFTVVCFNSTTTASTQGYDHLTKTKQAQQSTIQKISTVEEEVEEEYKDYEEVEEDADGTKTQS